ncbi:MAG TPA: calcium/proton exchanger [Candidatus Paceibacterota bacterium]|nr:calcium/proton exchanger [Candidatus Paceibacterota bacterium]
MTLERFFLALLVFVPTTFGAVWLSASPTTIFILAVLALIPLAKFLSDATEALAEHVGPAAGGLLNATFGNAPELVISAFALSAGLVDVVKASLIGSILGNLLLGLGIALFVGGMGRKKQEFNATAARSNASVLLLAATALTLPAFFILTPNISVTVIEHLSVTVSILLLVGYAATLYFTLGTHKHLYIVEPDDDAVSWSIGRGLTILLVATIAIIFVSDMLVSALTPLIATLGWPPLFVGAIVLATAGNAAEYLAAIRAAARDKITLATQISLGSAVQILLFVIPAIVIASFLLGDGMNLEFPIFELVAIVFAIFTTNSIIEDGETNWLEGILLIIVFCIVGAAFFFHP